MLPDAPLELGDYQGPPLAVRPAGLLGGPKLLVGGEALKPQKGVHRISDQQGRPFEIRLRYLVIDPYPRVEINGQQVHYIWQLPWYAYAWAAVPLFLVFIGGALGGGIGATAALCNIYLLRSRLPGMVRWLVPGVVSALAIVTFFTLAAALHLAIASS